MQNISLIGTVVLEKKSFERFSPYMGIAAILNFEGVSDIGFTAHQQKKAISRRIRYIK